MFRGVYGLVYWCTSAGVSQVEITYALVVKVSMKSHYLLVSQYFRYLLKVVLRLKPQTQTRVLFLQFGPITKKILKSQNSSPRALLTSLTVAHPKTKGQRTARVRTWLRRCLQTAAHPTTSASSHSYTHCSQPLPARAPSLNLCWGIFEEQTHCHKTRFEITLSQITAPPVSYKPIHCFCFTGILPHFACVFQPRFDQSR